MSLPDDLAQRIEDTRITYPDCEGGVTIRGSPFTCEFPDPVNPPAFCDSVTTAEMPWRMFGLKTQIGDDYWKVVGTLFHVEAGEVVDSSRIAFEVAPEWMRVYVKEDCSAARVAEFVRALHDEYGVKVTFSD